MIEQIRKCQKCGLCFNQKPLLDVEKRCQVFWVGLSAKKITSDIELPLSPETNTGMLIQKIEEMCEEVSTYKTNLVKLRYPNRREIDSCFEHLISEISTMSPRIVFLLGEKVYSSVGRHLHIQFDKWNDFEYHYKKYNGIYFVPIHHPSYIYVYKRKYMSQYVKSIQKIISDLL